MDKNKMSIPIFFEKLKSYEIDNDERITRVKIWLLHLGKNFNGSIFNKEIVDNAIPSLAYCPVVGFIKKNSEGEDDFSDHHYIIIKDENGLRQKYVGSAYGVILSEEENNAQYEERLCEDGETRTFLTVEAIMWNMFEDSSEIINRDQIKSQSMELFDLEDSYDGYEDDDGYFVFTKFSFRAACLLGEDYEPAMINSTVEVVNFTLNNFIKSVQSELNHKYTAFTKMLKSTEGGRNTMDKNEKQNTDFSQTVLSQINDISNLIENKETIETSWGYQYARYSLIDVQDNEVIVIDRKNNFNYYGMTFTLDNDQPVVDFESAKRKKIVYEDYVEGDSNKAITTNFSIANEIENVVTNMQSKITEAETKVSEAENAKTEVETKYTAVQTELDEIKAQYEEIKPKYENYVAAEKQKEAEELDKAKDNMLSQFEKHLGSDDDFISIKDNKAQYSVDEIEAKCSIMLFRKNKGLDFTKPSGKDVALGIPETKDDNVNDGVLHIDRYGDIPINNK